MKSTDLTIPIYLNQQIVFDLLAVLDDGFSTLSTIRTSSAESETSKHGVGASIGVSNVFALLGVSFSGERGKEKGLQEQTEVSQERIHTPTSLFAKLRLSLHELGLVKTLTSFDSFEDLNSSEFTEFRAILRKNPLVGTIEAMKPLVEMADLFQEGGSQKGSPNQQKGKNKRKPNNNIVKQMEGVLSALQANSTELVGELLDASNVTAVLTARPDFFSQGAAADIIDGEFSVFAKVVRVLKRDSDETINLLRKTALGQLNADMIESFVSAFSGLEQAGLAHQKFITKIDPPALLAIPIAIFI